MHTFCHTNSLRLESKCTNISDKLFPDKQKQGKSCLLPKKKKKGGKKKKSARHHARAWPSPSSSSSASFLPPTGPSHLPFWARREPSPRCYSPPAALTPRISQRAGGHREAGVPRARPRLNTSAPASPAAQLARRGADSSQSPAAAAAAAATTTGDIRAPPPRDRDTVATCLRTCYRRR